MYPSFHSCNQDTSLIRTLFSRSLANKVSAFKGSTLPIGVPKGVLNVPVGERFARLEIFGFPDPHWVGHPPAAEVEAVRTCGLAEGAVQTRFLAAVEAVTRTPDKERGAAVGIVDRHPARRRLPSSNLPYKVQKMLVGFAQSGGSY